MSAGQRRALEKVTTGDLGGGILNRQQFEQFFEEVQDSAMLLDMVRVEPVSAPKTQIDKIGVGERLRESRSENTAGTKESVTTGTVNIDTEKGGIDWQLTRESIEDNIEGEQLAQRIMRLMAQQFAVDTQDLAINGDSTGAGFVAQNDGWLKIAADRGMPQYHHDDAGDGTGIDQPIDKSLFNEMLMTIDSKYLRTDPVFVLSRPQLQAFKNGLTDRNTAAGDAMLLSDSDVNPFGYDIVAPSSWPDDKALLTDPRNLIYAPYRNVSLRTLTESDDILEQDLYAKYSMTVRDDFQIEDEKAGVLASDIAVPA